MKTNSEPKISKSNHAIPGPVPVSHKPQNSAGGLAKAHQNQIGHFRCYCNVVDRFVLHALRSGSRNSNLKALLGSNLRSAKEILFRFRCDPILQSQLLLVSRVFGFTSFDFSFNNLQTQRHSKNRSQSRRKYTQQDQDPGNSASFIYLNCNPTQSPRCLRQKLCGRPQQLRSVRL